MSKSKITAKLSSFSMSHYPKEDEELDYAMGVIRMKVICFSGRDCKG